MRFEELLADKGFLITASLPQNDVVLAQAAVRGGADALKVHINVEHRASGTVFGPWEKEKARIMEILDTVEVPVGIMAGADPLAVARDAPHLVGEGLGFIDAYAAHIPARLLELPPAPFMVALDHTAKPAQAEALSILPNVACLEASIMAPDAYGQPLTLSDLAAYQGVVKASRRPVIVPAQKRLVLEDLVALREVGVKGVLLGAVVYGGDAGSIEAGVHTFKSRASKEFGSS